MKIVVDTNVVISALFFHGEPGRILDAVIREQIKAFATAEIVSEYERIRQRMQDSGRYHCNPDTYALFRASLSVIEEVSSVQVCRDPDGNKFPACAKDAKALYIVSGDKDLLVLREFEGTEILTAAEF